MQAGNRQAVVKKNQVIDIRITDLAFGGTGVGKINTPEGEFAVFVENTIPGQLVRARVTKNARRFAECRLLEIIERSPEETEIPYQSIPGAPYA
ncbi:MAG: TRAM domain-containing protein, partial [Bacteroidota bacterium]